MDATSSIQNVKTALESAINTDTMFTNLSTLIPVVGGANKGKAKI